MFEWFFSKPIEKPLVEAKLTPELLREKAKELAEIDHSWKVRFCCVNLDEARARAGFTHSIINSIEEQIEKDRVEKLKDPKYVKKLSRKLEETDDSWRAHWFGKSYARKNDGFKPDEIRAINKLREDEVAQLEAVRFKSTIKSFFWGEEKPAQTTRRNTEIVAEIKKRHAERKDNLASKR